MTRTVKLVPDTETTRDQKPYYWQTYGFKKDPFGPENSALYFATEQYEQYFQRLSALSPNDAALMLLLGDAGIGKTTLLTQLFSRKDQNTQRCLIKGNGQFNLQHLISSLCEHFHFPAPPPDTTARDYLNSIATELDSMNTTYVLFIDNAQTLPLETLSALVQLAALQPTGHVALHIVLVAEPGCLERLTNLIEISSYDISPTIWAIKPLSLSSTFHYLQYRFQKANGGTKFPLTDSEVNEVYILSNGIAGRINYVTKQKMIDKLKEKESHRQPPTTKTKFLQANRIVLITIMSLTILAIVLWQKTNFNQHSVEMNPIPLTKETANLALMKSHQPSEAALLKTMSFKPFSFLTYSVIPNGLLATNDQEAIDLKESNQLDVSFEIPIETLGVKHVIIPPIADMNPPAIPETKAYSSNLPLNHEQGYTLQLVAAHHLKGIHQFITAHRLANQISIYQSKFKQQQWYVLLYGHYTSFKEARLALKKLSLPLRNAKPYVRYLPHIHARLASESYVVLPEDIRFED